MAIVSSERMAGEKWSLTQQAWDGLLESLAPDRDTAASKYLEIRRNLVRLFEWRGCPAPDEYADETINRCARKIAAGEQIRDAATYCIGIARLLLREMSRDHALKARSLDSIPEPYTIPPEPGTNPERRLDCLRECLSSISAANRDLILNYYQGDKSAKIGNRKSLMERFGIPAGALRMRALRVRDSLQMCSERCFERQGENVS